MATSTILNYEEMTFIIDLKKPLGMGITHQDNTHYHAVITAINPDQQANAAGVQIGMHIHSINGRKCVDRSLEWVIGLVKKAKSNVERNVSMEMICAKETAPEEEVEALMGTTAAHLFLSSFDRTGTDNGDTTLPSIV